ncbi:MAG: hypothetical protein JW840_09260 [Candidatus Thermoplasmatota archaeon]|nr:hypothetical protein [Candidatus Thermoplasmatota archaeon]
MKAKLLKDTEKQKKQGTEQSENHSIKEENVEKKDTGRNIVQLLGFHQYSALTKLRIAVSTIFSLCTIALIFIFVGGWLVSAFLLLIGYILLFMLMIELLRVKKL